MMTLNVVVRIKSEGYIVTPVSRDDLLPAPFPLYRRRLQVAQGPLLSTRLPGILLRAYTTTLVDRDDPPLAPFPLLR